MKTVLEHKDAKVEIEELIPGRRLITVRPLDKRLFLPK